MSEAALQFSGIVEIDRGGLCDVGPRVGDVDIIEVIEGRYPYRTGHRPQVRVFLGVEPVATGPLWAIHGFAGTDVTPYESPEITVGDYDLLERLNDLEGREVLLVIEPA